MITIYYSSHFKKSARKLNHKRKQIKKRIEIFRTDPFSKRLKTHKLSGKLENYWSFSVDYHTRILFEFVDKKTVAFIDIGTHEIYKR